MAGRQNYPRRRRYSTGVSEEPRAEALAQPAMVLRARVVASPTNRPKVRITYIPTCEGWLYLAAILDLYSRFIVGWAMSDRMWKVWCTG